MLKSRKNTYTAILIVLDFLLVALAVIISFKLKFGFLRPIPHFYTQNQEIFVLCSALIFWGLSFLLGVYARSLTPLTSSFVIRSMVVVFALLVMLLGLDRILGMGIPLEIIIIFGAILFCTTVSLRLLPAFGSLYYSRQMQKKRPGGSVPCAIYGGGELGRYLATKLIGGKGKFVPLVFLDDDPKKWGTYVSGLRVQGGIDQLEHIAQWKGLGALLVAIADISPSQLQEIMQHCKAIGLEIRYFGISGGPSELRHAKVMEIAPEELLHRQSVQLDLAAVTQMLADATVLVSGGAGSIGSEICTQCLRFGAKRLIVCDINENGLFDLSHKLLEDFAPESFKTLIASVRDKPRMDEVFATYKPQVVFHAAAHKHVPMMEHNPVEAIKNNVFGTLNIATAAQKHGVRQFILISTDKAVNPTNVMGATKRVAERIIQWLGAAQGGTVFAAVRFGNVLGSQGSVVPLFKKQILAGGPVTVTHKDMCRYFMTIPEAVQLVLEAGSMAHGAEIFVLDMGQPVKIYDLACDLIRLSGLIPHQDIDIQFCGMRPGEKLFEEIALTEETSQKTKNQKIFINSPLPCNQAQLQAKLRALQGAVEDKNQNLCINILGQLVPTFVPQKTK